jgi:hypothetical protein
MEKKVFFAFLFSAIIVLMVLGMFVFLEKVAPLAQKSFLPKAQLIDGLSGLKW